MSENTTTGTETAQFPQMQRYGDNIIPIIKTPYQEHTPARPFCWDMTCPCHRDRSNLRKIHQAHKDGLITGKEANLILAGQTI